MANPVTDLGYGALIGSIITGGLLVQLRSPHRKIAGLQQTALAALALLLSVPLAEDDQNLVPGLIALATVGIAVALHPGRHEFLLTGTGFSPGLAAVAALSGGPLLAYALSMSEQARELVGPPYHIQRLATMATMAIAIVLTGLLAAIQTRGGGSPRGAPGRQRWCSASLPWSSPPTGDPRVAGGGHWLSEVASCSSPSLRDGLGGNVEARPPRLEREHRRIRCPKGRGDIDPLSHRFEL